MAWYEFRPYVSAAEKRRRGAREMARLSKKGLPVEPVIVEGRAITRTFWGKAWCDHLERYCDFENRLPRGRTYVRNGSVLHLGIEPSCIRAFVQGSELYEVQVSVSTLAKLRWKGIVAACAGEIDSLVELLQGRLSSGVMKVVTDPRRGLFPEPAQIEMKCSCPDWATMCKHVAAVLYGIGARLDAKPELLFVLRGVNHLDLLDGKAAAGPAQGNEQGRSRKRIADDKLGSIFGIDIDPVATAGAREAKTAEAPAAIAPRARRKGGAASPVRVRRSHAPIADMIDGIVALLRRHPAGLRAGQIRAELAIPAKDLSRLIAEGVATKRLRRTGRARATVYFAGR